MIYKLGIGWRMIWGAIALSLAPIAIGGTFGLQRTWAAPGRPKEATRRPPALSLERMRRVGQTYVADLADGSQAELTLRHDLQSLADRLLGLYHEPYGAAVMVGMDGRVLAMAGRSKVEPEKSVADLCLKPWAPAASIFKIVTAAALIDQGVLPTAKVCYHDGVHSVEESNLVSHPRWDRACNTFAFGLAKSQNAIMARLANEHLDGPALEHTARALGFGEQLPFELVVTPSIADVPRAHGLPFARVASGFWQTSLSPLHGAFLAATIARGGSTPPLRIVNAIVRNGETLTPEPPAVRRVLDESTARAVGSMMVGTTSYGTARLGFHDKRGRSLLPGIHVAGKTGSLNRKEGAYLAYSWFVGYAPAERPTIAVAVLLGNEAGREIKAHRVARELLAGYFNGSTPIIAAR